MLLLLDSLLGLVIDHSMCCHRISILQKGTIKGARFPLQLEEIVIVSGPTLVLVY